MNTKKYRHESNLSKLLLTSRLFSKLTVEELTPIINNAKRVTSQVHEKLDFNSCYLIENGHMMIYCVTQDGDVNALDILNKGCVFGARNLISNVIQHQLLVKTIENAVLWRIPKNILLELMDEIKILKMNFLSLALDTNLFMELALEHSIVKNASQRIACSLLRRNEFTDKVPANIQFPYKKQYIAAKLGIRQETFSRALQTLKLKADVSVKGSNFIVNDIDKLEDYTCHSCSLQYPCHVTDSRSRIY